MNCLKNILVRDISYKFRFVSHNSNELSPIVQDLFSRLKSGQRAALAECITLVESTNLYKKSLSKDLLSAVLKTNRQGSLDGQTLRLGISGPPGAGKSTFIETFGRFLTEKELKVAVLAIDPSSAMTGGSILGDKTRMPYLSKNPNAYIRASPASGHLGGTTRSTNDAIALCESSGYHVVIVETVGVGQSEFAVTDMVDMFVLIIPPGGGDELQGLKRGIMEMSDLVVVNKADGDMVLAAKSIQMEYRSALKFIRPRFKEWKTPVKLISSLNGDGIDELWKTMNQFTETMKKSGQFLSRRQKQQKIWLWNYLMDNIVKNLHSKSSIQETIKHFENEVMKGNIVPSHAADLILEKFVDSFSKGS